MQVNIKHIFIVLFTLLTIGCSENTKIKFTELNLYDLNNIYFNASSELEKPERIHQLGRYNPKNLFDNAVNTAWAEGAAGSGINEHIIFSIKEGLEKISITNGYAKNINLFKANNRVKKLKAEVAVGINKPGFATEVFTMFDAAYMDEKLEMILKDTIAPQEVKININWEKIKAFKEKIIQNYGFKDKEKLNIIYILKLTIKDIYKGEKYNDTCITEISFNKAKSDLNTKAKIEKIYVKEPGKEVYIYTTDKKNIQLDKTDEDLIFDIFEVSQNKKYAIVSVLPKNPHGPVIETYNVYDLTHKNKVIIKDMRTPAGFSYENQNIYIEYLDKNTFEKKKFKLE